VAGFAREAEARGSRVPTRVLAGFTREAQQLCSGGTRLDAIAAGLRHALNRRFLDPRMLETFIAEAALPETRNGKKMPTRDDFPEFSDS
jgi:hypothetical protein